MSEHAMPREFVDRGGNATRRRILAVALDLFADVGFAATSVRAIADACDISDAALYYHFPSKRAILTALWDQGPQRPPNVLSPSTPINDARLMALVESALDGAAVQDRLLRVVAQQALEGDPVAIRLRADTMAFWRRNVLQQMLPGRSHEEADLLAHAFITVINGAVLNSQVEYQRGFPSACRQSAFRDHVKEVVRFSVPLHGVG
jgi:AcrR family transcriptional regulator